MERYGEVEHGGGADYTLERMHSGSESDGYGADSTLNAISIIPFGFVLGADGWFLYTPRTFESIRLID